jgi:hypothetical protein
MSVIWVGTGRFTSSFDFLNPANIGQAVGGGFFGGLISHTADGVATHALIVAPAATGASGTGYPVTTNYAWKTANTTTDGTNSAFDGAANTAAMVAAGIADHPAAQFCVNLTIGGFTDWYLPARFESDIAYFHLKPDARSNATTTGINPYSVPARASDYTASVPGQTGVLIFRTGGGEDFRGATGTPGVQAHWSSTQSANSTSFLSAFADGSQLASTKNNTRRVRAFRRIAL